MTGLSLAEWIGGRPPRVPEAFLRYLTPGEADAPATPDALVGEAREALHRALTRDASDRGGAFELLAADAWATWAAEAALEADDPEAELLEQLRALQRRIRSDE